MVYGILDNVVAAVVLAVSVAYVFKTVFNFVDLIPVLIVTSGVTALAVAVVLA